MSNRDLATCQLVHIVFRPSTSWLYTFLLSSDHCLGGGFRMAYEYTFQSHFFTPVTCESSDLNLYEVSSSSPFLCTIVYRCQKDFYPAVLLVFFGTGLVLDCDLLLICDDFSLHGHAVMKNEWFLHSDSHLMQCVVPYIVSNLSYLPCISHTLSRLCMVLKSVLFNMNGHTDTFSAEELSSTDTIILDSNAPPRRKCPKILSEHCLNVFWDVVVGRLREDGKKRSFWCHIRFCLPTSYKGCKK